MKVKSNIIEDCQVFLTIELDPDEVEKQKQESYKKLVKTTKIPGFREGKAPRSVLEKHIGEDALLDDALKSLIPKSYFDVLEEQKIQTISEPSIKVTSTKPVIFEAKAPLPPKVELGNHYQIKMKPDKVKVKKEDIDDVIEQLRERNATFEPVERPVMDKDVVNMDVSASVEGKSIIVEKGLDYQVIGGLTFPALGFPEALLSLKKGDEKEIKLKLSENFYVKDAAGKEADFKVIINEVKETKLPQADDAFAKNVIPDVESLVILKERIKTDLKTRAEEKARIAFEEKLIEELVKISKVEFPPFLVDMEVNQLVSQNVDQIRRSCQSEEQFNSMMEKMPQAEMQEKYRPVAETRVIGRLALEELARLEKIEVSDDDISQEIERMTANAGVQMEEQRKLLSSPQYKAPIQGMIISGKAIKKLSYIAQGVTKKTKPKTKKKPQVEKEAE